MHIRSVTRPRASRHECSRCLVGATPEPNGLVHVSHARSKLRKEEEESIATVSWEGQRTGEAYSQVKRQKRDSSPCEQLKEERITHMFTRRQRDREMYGAYKKDKKLHRAKERVSVGHPDSQPGQNVQKMGRGMARPNCEGARRGRVDGNSKVMSKMFSSLVDLEVFASPVMLLRGTRTTVF